MTINIKDILTLDDNNEYMVISKTKYKDKTYYYLMDDKNSNVLFCYEDKDELVELKDKNLTTKLLPLFLKEASKELNKKV